MVAVLSTRMPGEALFGRFVFQAPGGDVFPPVS
jgi:hypothetical protein